MIREFNVGVRKCARLAFIKNVKLTNYAINTIAFAAF